MHTREQSPWWHHRALNISGLQALHTERAFPRHSHDYYVIAVVNRGAQSFLCRGTRYYTPTDGLILLNPDEAHTGEPVDADGFEYCALYPTVEHVAQVAAEVGACGGQPYFVAPRADDLTLARRIRALVAALCADEKTLAGESAFLLTLVALMKRYGGLRWTERTPAHEPAAVRHVRDYIDAHFDQPISLADLADQVHFSRYYLLRAFRQATGLPPHQYLDSARVRHAQKLLGQGEALADVAVQAGFGSQSHMTQRFRQIIGITPGVYARQLRNG